MFQKFRVITSRTGQLLLVNPAYDAIMAEDCEALRQLSAAQPDIFSEPAAYAFGEPLTALSLALIEENARVIITLLEMGCPLQTSFLNLANPMMGEALFIALEIPLSTEICSALLQVTASKTDFDKAKVHQSIDALINHERSDLFLTCFRHTQIRQFMLEDYALFKKVVSLLTFESNNLSVSLIEVCTWPNKEMVQRLATDGIDLLSLAVAAKDSTHVHTLLTSQQVSIETKLVISRENALFAAIKLNLIDIVFLLLEFGAPDKQLLFIKPNFFTPLSYAIYCGHHDLAALLEQRTPLLRYERINYGPIQGTIPFEAALHALDETRALQYFPISLGTHSVTFPMNEASVLDLVPSFLMMATKNALLCILFAIEKNLPSLLQRACQKTTEAFFDWDSLLSLCFTACVIHGNSRAWELLQEHNKGCQLSAPLSKKMVSCIFNNIVLFNRDQQHAARCKLILDHWPLFESALDEKTLGITVHYDIYSRFMQKPNGKSHAREKLEELLTSATCTGQWPIIQNILHLDPEVGKIFSLLFLNHFDLLMQNRPDLELFRSILFNHFKFRYISVVLIYVMRLLSRGLPFEFSQNNETHSLETLFTRSDKFNERKELLRKLRHSELDYETKDTSFELYLNEISPLQESSAPMNDYVMIFLELLEEKVLKNTNKRNIFRAICLLPFLKSSLAHTLINGNVTGGERILEFTVNHHWLTMGEVNKYVIPFLLQVAMRFCKRDAFEWALKRYDKKSKLLTDEMITCTNDVRVTPKTVPVWDFFDMLFKEDELNPEKTKVECHIQLFLILYHGPISIKEKSAGWDLMIRALGAYNEIIRAMVHSATKEFLDFFSAMPNPIMWLSEFAKNQEQRSDYSLLEEVLKTIALSQHSHLIPRLLSDAIMRLSSPSVIECIKAIQSVALTQQKRMLQALIAKAPLAQLLKGLMTDTDTTRINSYYYFWLHLVQGLNYPLENRNECNAIANAYSQIANPLNQELIEKLLGKPILIFLNNNGVPFDQICRYAIKNQNVALLEQTPELIPALENKHSNFQLICTTRRSDLLTLVFSRVSDVFLKGYIQHCINEKQSTPLRLVLSIAQQRLSTVLPKHLTPLHLVCLLGEDSLLKSALVNIDDVHQPLEITDEISAFLKNSRRSPNLPKKLADNITWMHQLTAFEIAVICGYSNCVKALAKTNPETYRFFQPLGFDPRIQNCSLITFACETNQVETVEALIHLGVDPYYGGHNYPRTLQATDSPAIKTLLRNRMRQFADQPVLLDFIPDVTIENATGKDTITKCIAHLVSQFTLYSALNKIAEAVHSEHRICESTIRELETLLPKLNNVSSIHAHPAKEASNQFRRLLKQRKSVLLPNYGEALSMLENQASQFYEAVHENEKTNPTENCIARLRKLYRIELKIFFALEHMSCMQSAYIKYRENQQKCCIQLTELLGHIHRILANEPRNDNNQTKPSSIKPAKPITPPLPQSSASTCATNSIRFFSSSPEPIRSSTGSPSSKNSIRSSVVMNVDAPPYDPNANLQNRGLPEDDYQLPHIENQMMQLLVDANEHALVRCATLDLTVQALQIFASPLLLDLPEQYSYAFF